ncbi:hypothetical protein G6F40_016275 [Rhizopus arrhizus]|nr:hypothetical protein G6F40_016275 [Rhizopus arrhizus]
MDDGTAVLRPVDQRDVLRNTVEGLHLEAPPVGPQRAADAIGGQPVSQLVGLDAVVERGHIEAEFLGQVEHGGHLVGAVAVDVHADVALDGAGQRVQLEVALAAGIPGAVALVAAEPALARGRRGLPATLPMRVAGATPLPSP